MDWTRFRNEVPTTFPTIRLSLAGGTVRVPPEPVELESWDGEDGEDGEALEEAEAGEAVGGSDALEEEFPVGSLLSFNWEGFGPISWSAALFAVGLGRNRIVICWYREEEPDLALALVEAPHPHPIWNAFIQDLFASNGRMYGIQLFGSLPSETLVRSSHFDQSSLKEAFWLAMEEMERERAGAWSRLRDETIARVVEPNPLARSMGMLKELARLGLEGYMAAEAAAVEELPEAERREILETFLHMTCHW